ncbi:hypothetical protein BXZ70DRAFT_941747 [Cristinia sonorae]|uniref:Uncharacterized protein n=1 Tax=Cristinia sonorae TaxID=1940300 RepID=A0A8K0UPF3_9AGAR|nr:hypothetical protein BXZ70DRAFT_941747 [Cristinia sonorae]
MMMAFASMNLAIRTMVIWSAKYVTIVLSILCVGHWGVVMSATTVRTEQVPGQGCVAVETKRVLLMLVFIYTLAFDATIFLLTAWKLSGGRDYHSRLVRMLFRDGLVYFLLVTIMNIPVVVFSSLNLNPIMNIIFNIPAATLSSILACRATRRLACFAEDPTIYTASGLHISPMVTDNEISFATRKTHSTEVRVHMDTFIVDGHPDANRGYLETDVKPGSRDVKNAHGV